MVANVEKKSSIEGSHETQAISPGSSKRKRGWGEKKKKKVGREKWVKSLKQMIPMV